MACKREEASFVNIAAGLLERDNSFAKGMSEYLEKLRKQQLICPEEVEKESREALIKAGILTKDGRKKEIIVSWE